MAYQANREGTDKDLEEQRNNQNNANNIRNAADVAIASKNPYAMAAGGAVKAADKITGGKSTEALGKAISTANKIAPGGRHIQNASNRLSESGVSDKIGQAAAMKNGMQGGGNTPNQVVNRNTAGGGQESSLPSSDSKIQIPNQNRSASSESTTSTSRESSSKKSDANDEQENSKKGKGLGAFAISAIVKAIIIVALPLLVILLVLVILIAGISSIFSDYDDAFGISQTAREETGGYYFQTSSQEQQDFYDRVNDVKLKYQAQGKVVDPLKIVAIYHIINSNGSKLSYSDMTEAAIMEFANTMFLGNTYNEETFKNNLVQSLFPKYLPNSTTATREQMANDVLAYVDNYNSLVGKDTSSTTSICASSGSCNYDIKGFYIQSKGNVSQSMQINDLYVRLMQCGTANGHNYGGTFGQALEGEELVPFEKYILGVAYQEIGEGAPAEAIKAQMVAARSYILARHVDMGGWRTLQQESNGKWVIQVASCTQDQVYCNPDKGCSGTDGQWGQIYSGTGHGSFSKGPLAESSSLRTYASATSGEVLVNAQGYIIYSGYTQTEQNKFISLANAGLTYKQILLQVYNQGSRNYGASTVQKESCKGSSSTCRISTGEYASWKQYQGSWIDTPMGNSGKNIRQIGCLVTSVSMLIAKSGVQTNIANFNPGTFVEFLNSNGGFVSGGNFVWGTATLAAPSFQYQGKISVSGMSKEEKLNKIKELVSQSGVYVVAEVKGNTGQHWVAIDSVVGDTVNMMDPGSEATDMWSEYNWANTSALAYYRVS